jgi:hypothetical protein
MAASGDGRRDEAFEIDPRGFLATADDEALDESVEQASSATGDAHPGSEPESDN